MSGNNRSSWMVSSKSFVKLIGAEYGLMRDAGVLTRFYTSSLLVIIIMLLTWISIYYAIDLLFHSIITEISLAIFFCLLFVCIYIFLLNTFAKQNRAHRGIMNLSNVIRIGFVAFMGFLIAQPLVVLLYSTKLSPAVEEYKRHLIQVHTDKMDALVRGEVMDQAAWQKYYMQQKDAQQTIDRSSFFLYQVKKAGREYPLSWASTFLVMLLFLLPGYLIYSIPSGHEYYRLKKTQEKRLVMAAYSSFLESYNMIFNEQVSVFSRYDDPPFNTVRKQLTFPASMTKFLEKYSDNG